VGACCWSAGNAVGCFKMLIAKSWYQRRHPVPEGAQLWHTGMKSSRNRYYSVPESRQAAFAVKNRAVLSVWHVLQQKCRNRRIWMGYLQSIEEDWYWMVLRTQVNSAVLRDMKLNTGTNLHWLTQQRSSFEIQTTVTTSNILPQFLFSFKIHSLSGVLMWRSRPSVHPSVRRL